MKVGQELHDYLGQYRDDPVYLECYNVEYDRQNFDFLNSEIPSCGMVDIADFGDARYLNCHCLGFLDEELLVGAEVRNNKALLAYIGRKTSGPRLTYDSPRLMAAYKAARQARFEHGERSQVHIYKTKLNRIREMLDSDDVM
jgi:hypothetical protein